MRNKVLPSHQVSFAFHCYRKFNKRDTCRFVLNWFFYLGTKVEAKTSGNLIKLGKIRNMCFLPISANMKLRKGD